MSPRELQDLAVCVGLMEAADEVLTLALLKTDVAWEGYATVKSAVTMVHMTHLQWQKALERGFMPGDT